MTPATRFFAALLLGSLAGCAETPQPSFRTSSKVIHFDPALARDTVTAYRRSNGLTPVSLDASLTAFAREQAQVMADKDKLSHDVGGSFSSRLESAGLANGRIAENVSYGTYTEEAAIAQWRASPGHDKNLRMPGATRFGIAYAKSNGPKQRVYWAMAIAADPPKPVATLASTGGPAAIMGGRTVVVRRRVEEPSGGVASVLAAPFAGLLGN